MTDKYGEIAPYYDMIYGTDIDYEAESLGLHEIFKAGGVESILDIACGTAAHLIRLGELGYKGTGIDSSGEMLGAGRKGAAGRGVSIDLLECDMKHIEVEKTFDAVISLYALGLNAGPQEVKDIIKSIPPLIKENGFFVFNLMNAGADWGGVEPSGPYLAFDAVEDRAAGVKATWIYQTTIEGKTQRLNALYIVADRGKTSMYVHNHCIATFGVEETGALLEECGFKIEMVYGSAAGLPEFSGTEPSMLVVARRAVKSFDQTFSKVWPPAGPPEAKE